MSGSSSGKTAHEFLLPDRLGWDTGSFQSSRGKNDNTYINQSHISYLGSLPLLQWGQIKDFTSLRNIGNGPLEVLLLGFFVVVLMDYTPQCWHIFSTLSPYYYWTAYFGLIIWHNYIAKKAAGQPVMLYRKPRSDHRTFPAWMFFTLLINFYFIWQPLLCILRPSYYLISASGLQASNSWDTSIISQGKKEHLHISLEK